LRIRPARCPAALSFMSEGPHDIRPALVSLYYAGEEWHLEAVLGYGITYLRTWLESRGEHPKLETLRWAVADGLLKLYMPDRCPPTDQRASQLKVRASSYRRLKAIAHDLYRTRLTEGALRFVAAAANDEQSLPAATVLSPFAETTWWNKVEAGRPARFNLLKLEVGNRDRPPASDPRAPSRDTGWLPNYNWAA
jgi:hypothetical protein